MIAADTNLLVRLVTNDDPVQAARAAQFFRRERVFVAKTVLLELEWVLRHAYELERSTVLEAIRGILGLPNVAAEDSLHVAHALEWYERGLDFADAIHLASSIEADAFATFDDRLWKKAASIGAMKITRL